MTQTFGSNPVNDIYIGAGGNLVIDRGQKAVEDACATASKTRLGECILQTGVGLPMFQAIFNGVPLPAVYENALRNTLAAVDGVSKVTVLDLVAAKNTFSYIATIETIYGQTFNMNG